MVACTSSSQSFVALARGFKRLHLSDPVAQCLVPRLSRQYATLIDVPIFESGKDAQTLRASDNTSLATSSQQNPASRFHRDVLTTLYSWPEMAPASFTSYPAHQLDLPLRKDILHRAVTYEADGERQGTASAKHRTQVHGSSRKVRPQKGTGRARLSDRKSPSIRGGGVAHGPHPRDFSTDLPRKIYDLAWRTALSYRYKKGELIISGNEMSLSYDQTPRFLHNLFESYGWGKGKGRSLVVLRLTDHNIGLIEALKEVGEHAEVRLTSEVDVKDLLSCGRVIIEKPALDEILRERSKHVTI